MNDEKPKTKAYYEKLSKCPKGGKHSLWKHSGMDNWMCRKCKKYFTKEDVFFIDRE